MAVLIASYVVFGEALALLGLAVFYVVETVIATPTRLFGALGGAGLLLGAAVLMALLARSLKKLKQWARTPIVVVQALCLPAGYSFTVQAGQWLYGLVVLLPTMTVLVALATPSARRSFMEQSQVDKVKTS